MTRLLLLALAVVALALWMRSRRSSRAAARAPAPRAELPDPDQLTLLAMSDGGVDLSMPTQLAFHLYFSTEGAAMAAAAQAATPALPARVRRGADGSGWTCRLSGTMVPAEDAIRAVSARLRAVADAHGGQYGYWDLASRS